MKEKYVNELKKALEWKRLIMVLLGNTIYAVGVVAFILPLDLITGGTTGIGLIMNHLFDIPLEVFALLFNVAMFLIAIGILGVSFAITTLISTFYYPVILGIMQKVEVLGTLTNDPMLGTICAGLLIGVGIGIVVRAGASTGGMDIPPLVCNKKLGLPVGVGLYAFDFVILLGQMVFRDSEEILYGILLVIIYSVMVDKVLVSGKSKIEVQIISDHVDQINEVIHRKIDRGTTFFMVETGYLHKKTKALMTVVSNRELVKLNQLVLDIDPKAFIVIHEAKEVMGKGFSMRKMYEKKD